MAIKHYLVVGLGITGYSVVKYLLLNKHVVTVTDSRSSPPYLAQLISNFPQVNLLLGQIVVPIDTDIIVLSPGVAIADPALRSAKEHNLPMIGDIELFAQVVDKPVLAITGSNGKSTVTTLLGLMAQNSGMSAGVGGNLGIPALDLLDPKHSCYILELSSFQLETTFTLHCQAVTILNVSPDHMDRYEDLAGYQAAKQKIYSDTNYAIYNRQDSLTAAVIQPKIAAISFGLDQPTTNNYGVTSHAEERWLCKGAQPLMPVSDLAMLGEHNVANALAALALGETVGLNLAAMLHTLKTFTGLPHRCEQIINYNNIVWVNDSKGTNVAATVTAIHGLAHSIAGKWIIVLGGQGKNADFSPLVEPVKEYCRAAILIGSDRQQLHVMLESFTTCYFANDLTEVITIAQKIATSGDGVLLSPACASLDMFANYMQRGDIFRQQVLQRIGKQHATTTD